MSLFRFAVFLLVVAAAAAARGPEMRQEKPTMLVDLTVELRVDTLTPGSYREFIQNLRFTLAKQYVNGVLALPPFDRIPHGFDVRMTWGVNRYTTVRVHHDTLVLRGFQMQDSQQWFEFPGKVHLIEGSKFLEFGNSLEDLEATAQQDVQSTGLSKYALGDAVQRLATSEVDRERAISLLVVSQMINEALKFNPIANYLADNIETTPPVTLPEWMLTDLETQWSDFSYIIFRPDEFVPLTINGQAIETVDELRPFLGIIRWAPLQMPPRFARKYKGALYI